MSAQPAIQRIREAANAEAYAAGREARLALELRHRCPYADAESRLRHFWLAGWHDQDMESDFPMFRTRLESGILLDS